MHPTRFSTRSRAGMCSTFLARSAGPIPAASSPAVSPVLVEEFSGPGGRALFEELQQ